MSPESKNRIPGYRILNRIELPVVIKGSPLGDIRQEAFIEDRILEGETEIMPWYIQRDVEPSGRTYDNSCIELEGIYVPQFPATNCSGSDAFQRVQLALELEMKSNPKSLRACRLTEYNNILNKTKFRNKELIEKHRG